MSDSDASSEGLVCFRGSFKADTSGRRGFAVRVVPNDDRLVGTKLPGKITWFNEGSEPHLSGKDREAEGVLA